MVICTEVNIGVDTRFRGYDIVGSGYDIEKKRYCIRENEHD